MTTITGKLVDIFQKRVFNARIIFEKGFISEIIELDPSEKVDAGFILPGFIDAHVHIESSMLVPSEFARLAVVHGTVGTVSDPHEIANVCGIKGVEFMIDDGQKVPFKFNFGAPSCVPATTFETAGASLDSKDVENLLLRDEIKYLSEMMNFPGVLYGDEEVYKKIKAAHKLNKPVDGHAPALRGDDAKKYIAAGLPAGEVGISTDHECFTKEEALDKLQYGMKIIIREGSAAKNFEALIELLHDYPEHIMFCSDDKHPDSLVEGHINHLCARAVAKGIDVFKILRAACVNPVLHYKLDVGLLRTGDAADFIVVNDLEEFKVEKTFINGKLVAEKGKTLIQKPAITTKAVNNFGCSLKEPGDFVVLKNEASLTNENKIPVIVAEDGQLITKKIYILPKVEGNIIVPDLENDILKIVVVTRYNNAPVAKAFIKNFGLKKGAIASSVAHDSHNIVAVGVDDESICNAVNEIIKYEGGVSLCYGSLSANEKNIVLALPIAGLMSAEDGYEVAKKYSEIDMAAKSLGSTLSSPFMTLSFMALLVIPHLKLSDKGLFDGDSFSFI